MTPAARIASAIELLEAVAAAPRRPADAIVHDFFRARRFIGGGDRRAVSDRAWGVVRQEIRLRWWLHRSGARAITPRLLVAAHLLLVDRAKLATLGRDFGGDRYGAPPLSVEEMAALQPLAGQELADAAMPDAVRLNLPDWAFDGLQRRCGAGLAAEAAAMDRNAPMDLRVNLLKATREGAAAALASEGVETEPTPYSPWGLRVPHRRPITATAAYKQGLVEVQDEGSQLIALLTEAMPGMRVADYCAGAAGKTLALAVTMENRGHIVACDVSAPRLEGASKRLRRAGIGNAETHLLAPGDRWAKRRAGSFDRVLVDAPCTGTGTWRRNPDGRLRTGPEDLAELLQKQAMILETASRLVRPGGRLIYATCSMLPEEDEMQVEAFLSRHPNFRAVPMAGLWEKLNPAATLPAGQGTYMSLSPALHDTDGFFAAVLERAPEPPAEAKGKARGQSSEVSEAAPAEAAGDPPQA